MHSLFTPQTQLQSEGHYSISMSHIVFHNSSPQVRLSHTNGPNRAQLKILSSPCMLTKHLLLQAK